jgi:hypothetical protein
MSGAEATQPTTDAELYAAIEAFAQVALDRDEAKARIRALGPPLTQHSAHARSGRPEP